MYIHIHTVYYMCTREKEREEWLGRGVREGSRRWSLSLAPWEKKNGYIKTRCQIVKILITFIQRSCGTQGTWTPSSSSPLPSHLSFISPASSAHPVATATSGDGEEERISEPGNSLSSNEWSWGILQLPPAIITRATSPRVTPPSERTPVMRSEFTQRRKTAVHRPSNLPLVTYEICTQTFFHDGKKEVRRHNIEETSNLGFEIFTRAVYILKTKHFRKCVYNYSVLPRYWFFVRYNSLERQKVSVVKYVISKEFIGLNDVIVM